MKKILVAFILVLIVLPSVRPLLDGLYFPMHDDTQAERVVAMGQSIREGQFPVRLVPGLGYGYGYPIFNFYGPLPYYFGGFLYAVGIEPITATLLMMIAGLALAAVSMYLLTRVFGRGFALASAALYLYTPYHAVQLFVRGAVGEMWAYGFLPLIFTLAFPGIFINRWLAVVGLSGIILSHTVTGYLITGMLLFAGLVLGLLSFRFRHLRAPVGRIGQTFLLSLGLTAFFWLPAFMEKQYTRVEGFAWDSVSLGDHFVCLRQFWFSPWGFGGSAPGCVDGMSFMLGKTHLLLALLGLAAIYVRRREVRFRNFGLVVFFLTLLALFFMNSLSGPVWKLVPFAGYIQYPWRLLVVSSLGLSFLGAAGIFLSKLPFLRISAAALIIFLAVFGNAKRFAPQYAYDYRVKGGVWGEERWFRASRISDEYLPPDVVRPENAAGLPGEAVTLLSPGEIHYEKITATYVKAFATVTGETTPVRFNRAYFPGWEIFVNGKKVRPQISAGLPVFEISAGTSVLEMRFSDTTIRRISNIISLAVLGIFLYAYGKKAVR